jgi:hypothetical protein
VSSTRLDADPIIDSASEPLFAAQIALRALHTDVAEQKLNLFQLAAGLMAQSRALEIMWCDAGHARMVQKSHLYEIQGGGW